MCRFHDRLVDSVVSSMYCGSCQPSRFEQQITLSTWSSACEPVVQQLQQHGVVGLYGMGGIGKTTLANAIYNRLRNEFPSASCHVMVGQTPNIEQLQTRILDTLCGPFAISRGSESNQAELQHRLQDRRVLLVLDNVWEPDHLQSLLVPVHEFSKVIVTSRDGAMLRQTMPELCRCQPACVPVMALSDSASLQLFCRHAFPSQQGFAPDGWDIISEKAARACAGLPLSLTVIGSFLQQKFDARKWEEALSRLHKARSLGGASKDPIFSTLKISFDDLAEEEQDMFMDVACVLLGQSSEQAMCAWETSLGLDNLVSRSLVSINGHGRLGMHDQLRDMGRSFTLRAGSRFHDKYVWDDKVHLRLIPHPDSGNTAAACHRLAQCSVTF